ncbi:MAG: TrkH family potassium uptake protein [Candidatus Omnitrophota bacterium]
MKISLRKFRYGIPLIIKDPSKAMMGVYCFIVLAGFILLSCPWFQKQPILFIDNLFTATSALTTTGLTTISVADNYNFGGQLLVLLMIQIGGLHYMSFGSLIMLTRRKKFTKYHENLIKSDFGLPDDFNIYLFLRSVLVFSLIVEAVGAVFLYFIFSSLKVANPLWNAIFHSISAFCTAGFSLFNTSLEQFVGHPMLNIVMFVLCFLGAVGFIVVTDFWQMWTGKQKSVTFTTKIILYFTTLVIAGGTLLLFMTNSFPEDISLAERAWVSLFQAMSALTTVGFNTYPISLMSHGSLYLLLILIFVGASPAGTGGGVKSTTIVAVLAQMVSTLRGKVNVTLMGYQIPQYRLRLASASFTFYTVILVFGIYLLNLVENQSMFALIFESASALGTVGLSMGITSSLTFAGKMIIIFLMMLGRIGPLSIGLAFFAEKDGIDDLGWQEDIAL